MKKYIINGALLLVILASMIVRVVNDTPDVRDAVASAASHSFINEEEFKPDYKDDRLVSEWGLLSNSSWMLDQVMTIVPYFAYEGINPDPYYPHSVIFVPLQGENAFHLGGQTDCTQRIIVNEKYAKEMQNWEVYQLLGTLTHELTHMQLGRFCSQTNYGADAETYTQVATLEVLAAMCNHSVEFACDSFWDEFSYQSASSLRAKWPDRFYEMFARMFIRNDMEDQYGDKSWRYWHQDLGHILSLDTIVTKYGARPYDDFVLKYLCDGGIPTGISDPTPRGNITIFRHVEFKLDDTKYLVGKYMPWYLYDICKEN